MACLIFSKVMFTFARQGKVERTEKLLEQLQDLYSVTGEIKFKPNDDCWKAMIISQARNGKPQQAQGILDELVERSIVEDNQQIMPKRSYFIVVLVAWTKDNNNNSSRGSEQAEKVLMRLLSLSKEYPNLLPDTKAFEKVKPPIKPYFHSSIPPCFLAPRGKASATKARAVEKIMVAVNRSEKQRFNPYRTKIHSGWVNPCTRWPKFHVSPFPDVRFST